MSRGISATSEPGGVALASEPTSAAYGFRSASAVVSLPVVHSADQSGSPPVTGTLPGGVYRGTAALSYGRTYLERIIWSNHGMTCHRSSGEGTRLYQKSQPVIDRASTASAAFHKRRTCEPPGRRATGSGRLMVNLHRPRRAKQLLDGF